MLGSAKMKDTYVPLPGASNELFSTKSKFKCRNKTKKIGNMAATQKFGHCGNRKQNLLHFTSFKIYLLELKVILM